MRDPRQFSNKRAWELDPELEDEAAIYDLVQRALSGEKANVPKYVTYIEKVVTGADAGVLPPIRGVSFKPLDVITSSGQTYALVPTGDNVLAVDGDTQVTSHFALATTPGISPEVKKAHANHPLAMVSHHGDRQPRHLPGHARQRPLIGGVQPRTDERTECFRQSSSHARPAPEPERFYAVAEQTAMNTRPSAPARTYRAEPGVTAMHCPGPTATSSSSTRTTPVPCRMA